MNKIIFTLATCVNFLLFNSSYAFSPVNNSISAPELDQNDTLAKQATDHSKTSPMQPVDMKKFLLAQLFLGEATHRYDLVKRSIERLELIAPNDPEVIAAHLRLYLIEGHPIAAKHQLEKLNQLAPDSEIYRQAQVSMAIAQPLGKQQLDQARLLVLTKHPQEAKKRYDDLFHGAFPTPELADEYWMVVAQIPGQEELALKKLHALYQSLQAKKIIPSSAGNNWNWQTKLSKKISQLVTTKGHKLLKEGKFEEAQKQFQEALQLDLNNVSASTGLVTIYKQKSPQKALTYLNSLPQDKQYMLQGSINSLKSSLLQQEAETYVARKQWSKALEKYAQARQLDPTDVWLTFHSAKVLYETGKKKQADNLFHEIALQQSTNPDQIYAYAIYLSLQNKNAQAIEKMNTLPKTKWNADMRQFVKNLQGLIVLGHAKALRDNGDKVAASAYLSRQALTNPVKMKLAGWDFQDGKYNEALIYYKEVKSQEPSNLDAYVGVIETLVALKRLDEAAKLLQVASMYEKQAQAKNRIDLLCKIANAWIAVGNLQKAKETFQSAKKLVNKNAPSMNNALVFRDAAELEQRLKEPRQAQQDYREAMVLSGITPIYPKDDITYSLLTRNDPKDDWLKKSIRAQAGPLYHQLETTVTVDYDYWTLSGSGGTSQLTASDTITQANIPWHNGRAFLRNDVVWLTAGKFATFNGTYYNNFGTCTNGCSGGVVQNAAGDSFTAGWQNEHWTMDVGETPIGFYVVNAVGSLSYHNDFHHIGWSLGASRRPMSYSLLSLAGTRDPNTGIVWGGVVSNNAILTLSYDRGGPLGFWANIDAGYLTGKNVPENQRARFMEGAYYKIVNQTNRFLSIGILDLYWRYQKNLDFYSLGQGGYYSPQRFFGFVMPVNYRQRKGRWTYEFGGTGSWTRGTSANSPLYPIPQLVPGVINGQNTNYSGSTTTGWGYSVLASAEYRLSSHFILGAAYDLQRTPYYTPSHASLYIRYSLEGWQGDLDMPINPLVRYSEFR